MWPEQKNRPFCFPCFLYPELIYVLEAHSDSLFSCSIGIAGGQLGRCDCFGMNFPSAPLLSQVYSCILHALLPRKIYSSGQCWSLLLNNHHRYHYLMALLSIVATCSRYSFLGVKVVAEVPVVIPNLYALSISDFFVSVKGFRCFQCYLSVFFHSLTASSANSSLVIGLSYPLPSKIRYKVVLSASSISGLA